MPFGFRSNDVSAQPDKKKGGRLAVVLVVLVIAAFVAAYAVPFATRLGDLSTSIPAPSQSTGDQDEGQVPSMLDADADGSGTDGAPDPEPAVDPVGSAEKTADPDRDADVEARAQTDAADSLDEPVGPEEGRADGADASVVSDDSAATGPDGSARTVIPDDVAVPAGSDLATSERPKREDFSWYADGLAENGPPQGAARLVDLDDVAGGWKGRIVSDPQGESGSGNEELLNVYIDGAAPYVTLDFDWYYIYMDIDTGDEDEADGPGDRGYEETSENTSFLGVWSDGAVDATNQAGDGVILSDFWYRDGRQYAIGRIIWPDGVTGEIALARP